MSQFPSHLVPAIETAFQQVFNTTEVTDISLLAGGLSASSVYKIVVQDRPYVLKLDTGLPANRATNLALAAAAGIAPSLHYQDTTTGISISDLIAGKPIRTVFTPEILTGKLANTIKAIHAVPCHNGGDDLLTAIDGMVNSFRQTGMLSGPVFDECFRHYEIIRNKYPWQDTDKVFSHNDLNPNNILCDGERIWIIDWDTAFLNDRYVDLANAANFFVHSEEQEKLLLDVYFNYTTDDYKKARFYIMRQLCRIIYAMLMFRLAAQGKTADHKHNQDMEGISLKEFGALMGAGKLSLASYEGQLMYGKALLNKAVHQMRSSRFTASLAQLG
ncbi:phosphotransferase [Chitinophaga tropicalis]|uniref:Phosphotransferase n=1 Tax=Chitinophaga tropicalis TaxID=2683588 RepID=A0A7K1TXG3_9BACT|nr:phosphotransferase [Chitinophaga tropicalis]MVT06730.1 phosphotransferase [Chitinophaga tropicalis]